jgi:prepilin peptidase dependent protein B
MNTHRLSRSAHGLSIVELLVGIAVGLFVLAGATMVATNQISDNRRLLLETQIQQDMRTAMDVIVRDIKRSGYSFHADQLPAVGTSPLSIGYSPAGALDAVNPLLYTYSAVAESSDNRTANPADPTDDNDFKGFRLNSGVIQVQLGRGNWQPLTDGDVVSITNFTATEVKGPPVPLPTATCSTTPCVSTSGCGPARVVTRVIQLQMVGEARHDPSVRRELNTAVRVRNDEVCL